MQRTYRYNLLQGTVSAVGSVSVSRESKKIYSLSIARKSGRHCQEFNSI